SQAWTRATPGGAKTGGGFLTIENKGTSPDKLIGASAEGAGKVEVHEMAMSDGVMKMRPVEGGLAIDPGKTVKLGPGGFHLMMMDLKKPLKQGDKMPVTLEFEKAGKVAVTLDVEGVGAPGPAAGGGMDMKKMDHSGMKM
ncbi:MAG: copper chaperone PCu(A)C, partial [Bradyrhizobium sp.]|nr:copper chaperone PCu(A)C [Bradyrhizobium sp.]